MAPEFWCQTTPTEFWCHGISGAKLYFADVAPLLEFGTKSLAPRLPVLLNTHLSETINLQTQQRDAHREGLRSLGQAIKNMMKGKR
ncbi:hypothetical protein Tco_1431743, partial [Tanacetum coccineum]